MAAMSHGVVGESSFTGFQKHTNRERGHAKRAGHGNDNRQRAMLITYVILHYHTWMQPGHLATRGRCKIEQVYFASLGKACLGRAQG